MLPSPNPLQCSSSQDAALSLSLLPSTDKGTAYEDSALTGRVVRILRRTEGVGVTAGGLTPRVSPRALGALLPHRLHRASVAPRARPCVSTCPQEDTGRLALNASAAIFVPRIPGPRRVQTRYPLRQRPIAGGGGSREPIGSEEAPAHPSPRPRPSQQEAVCCFTPDAESRLHVVFGDRFVV